jgi:Thioredoxin reductase
MKLAFSQFKIASIILVVILSGCSDTRSSSTKNHFDLSQLSQESNIVPIAVIGSGPAGLMAGIYGARGGKPTYVFEGNKPGGLLMDTTEVENWPGEISIKGPDIIEKMRNQAQHQKVKFIEDTIERVDFSHWPFKLYTENGVTITALSVVIATGATPKRLGVPGEDKYWGLGVTSCAVCDGSFFVGEKVVVIGGGDSAVEEAMQLAAYAREITILVRKDAMRAAPAMQEKLRAYDQVSILYNVDIEEIVGDDTKVTGVALVHSKTGERSIFPAAGVFLAVGHHPNSEVFKDAVAVNEGGYIKVEGRTQETSVPGVFAAGDVHDYLFRQAGSSAGFGIDAGLGAQRFLEDIGVTPQLLAELKPRFYGKAHDESASFRSVPAYEVKEIGTIDEFQALTSGDGVVVIDFWAEDCSSCKQMLPIFDTVAKEFEGKAVFAKVNTDSSPELVEKLFIQKVPTLLVFKDGGLVARFREVMSRKELAAFIEQFLG